MSKDIVDQGTGLGKGILSDGTVLCKKDPKRLKENMGAVPAQETVVGTFGRFGLAFFLKVGRRQREGFVPGYWSHVLHSHDAVTYYLGVLREAPGKMK